MLVEDDNNLREIYEARLLAEGYEIISAKDGEEALALAVKEKPDLIISDVMMPKISGFDMLDILRSTAETKNTKVIMMTALSQAEDKTRADRLGADRYLVKSQVTLEDVAKVAHEVLTGEEAGSTTDSIVAAPVVDTPQPEAPQTPVSTPLTEPTIPTADVASPSPVQEPVVPAPEPVVPAFEPSTPAAAPAVETAPAAEPTAATSEPVTTLNTETPAEVSNTELPGTPLSPGAITEDLTQTTAAEEEAIEDQIKAIFSDSTSTTDTTPEENVVETPPPGEGNDSGVPQPSFDVPSVPAPTSPPAVNQPVTSAPEPVAEPTPVAPVPEPKAPTQITVNDVSSSDPQDPAVSGKKVIKPINDISKGPDFNALLQKEAANEAVPPPTPTATVKPGDATSSPDQPNDSGVSPHDIAL